MPPSVTRWSFLSLAALGTAQAYFLMGANNVLTTERIDPIVNDGTPSPHVHTVFGGSNFRMSTNTSYLRQSECTSVPIQEDHSNYWVPTMYFQWKDGTFTSVNGGAVIYYLYDGKPGSTTAFPDNFRMVSGDPMLRTYDSNSHAQQAITFLCLDFNGVTTKHNELPSKLCPSGVRAQVNFQSCWDGKNPDSPDHKSHVAYLSDGPDSGDCKDPNFPVKLPRVFMEMYWATADFKDHVQDAMKPDQPFVFSNGDPTGYGYHGDYMYGWKDGVLQRVVDECDCDPNGSLDCCAAKGIFTLDKDSKCRITKAIDETTEGTLPKLPGNNPVQQAGTRATLFPDTTNPNLLSPIFVYRGDNPDKVGTPSGPAGTSGSQSGQNDSNGGDQANGGQQNGNSDKPPASGSSSGNTNGNNNDDSHNTDNSNTGTGTDSQQNGNSDKPPASGSSSGTTDGNNNDGSHDTDNSNTGTGTGTGTGTDGGSSDNGQSVPPTSSSPATPPPTPPPTSGSNNDNKGNENSNGGNQSNHSDQSPPSNPPSSGSNSGGTSNSSSQQSSSGSGSKTCKRGVKRRSSKGKRHGNSIHRRFHSRDF